MKIPEKAKRVFKGKIFDVYQWEQEMYDGSTATFEMLKRPDTVQIIATSVDKVLINYQSQPHKQNYYSLFGGRCEEGEDALTTAKREFLEESGFESHDWEEWKIYEPVNKIDWKIHTFIARTCEKIADQKLDPGEKIEVREVSFDEFIDIILSEKYWVNDLPVEILKMKVNNSLDEFKRKLFL